MIFGGTGVEGSSESDSGETGDGSGAGAAWGARGVGDSWTAPLVAMASGGGGTSSGASDGDGGSAFGVSSTVECLPVVHGGIKRNSSKVKNRGLQHFQPVAWSQPMLG